LEILHFVIDFSYKMTHGWSIPKLSYPENMYETLCFVLDFSYKEMLKLLGGGATGEWHE